MKQMLIVTGSGNSGKSTAVKIAYGAILQRTIAYQGTAESLYLYFSEREVGVSIRATALVGIATQGDSRSHVMNGLTFFLAQKSEIIICATRSRGASRQAAENFAKTNGYSVTHMPKLQNPTVGQQSNANKQFAKDIAKWAYKLLGI